MAKHNYKKRFMSSFINKKKQKKIVGEAKDVLEIELLEIPALAVNTENMIENMKVLRSGLNGNNIDELVKEAPAPKFIRHKKLRLVDATADTIVDSPFTETYQSNYAEDRRVENNLELVPSDSKLENK